MLETKNKEIKNTLQGKDTVKFIKSLYIWSCWKSAKPINARTNCNSYNGMDGTTERERPSIRWRDKIEEDSKIMGIKNRQTRTTDI